MTQEFAELRIESARQRAITILFREYQQYPARYVELIEYIKVRSQWSAKFVCEDYPEIEVHVTFDVKHNSYNVGLWKRIDRESSIEQPTLFK